MLDNMHIMPHLVGPNATYYSHVEASMRLRRRIIIKILEHRADYDFFTRASSLGSLRTDGTPSATASG